ncbi:MAG: 50S ribosomal protein L6 [Patescibacteria group bacterium]
MSRIGKKPIIIPDQVTVEITGDKAVVKGPKGELTVKLHARVQVKQEDKTLLVTVTNPDLKFDRSLWGLFRMLIANSITGVSEGYVKKLEINGVGYKALVKGQSIELIVGFSHPVNYNLPAGIEAKVEKNIITISGIDKQLVGEVAAQIRAVKKPEPYKGKGIKYADEVIRRKAGKVVKATAGSA